LEIQVYYPSGHSFTLWGKWIGLKKLKGLDIITIIVDRDCVLPGEQVIKGHSPIILDPRGVYLNKGKREILYNPRDQAASLETEWQDWLEEHPEWPRILEL